VEWKTSQEDDKKMTWYVSGRTDKKISPIGAAVLYWVEQDFK